MNSLPIEKVRHGGITMAHPKADREDVAEELMILMEQPGDMRETREGMEGRHMGLALPSSWTWACEASTRKTFSSCRPEQRVHFQRIKVTFNTHSVELSLSGPVLVGVPVASVFKSRFLMELQDL